MAYTQLLSHKVENVLGDDISDQVIWDKRSSIIGLLGVRNGEKINLQFMLLLLPLFLTLKTVIIST